MRWIIKPEPEIKVVKQLSNDLDVDLNIASLLVSRGITNFDEAKDFFRPKQSSLHDPYLMKDMDKAVSRIQSALTKNERILVYGDYDVDGTTSVAMLASYLENKTKNIETYIPDRFNEGYGISYTGIDYAADNNFTLVIALDCGVKAHEKIDYANKKGIDFIICDHHRPGNVLPKAIAILDPKRTDCNYPYKDLCGCGVGFKLIQALGKQYSETTEELMIYLDLVAIAIGADIVSLTGENRILAYYGVKLINSKPRPGIQALIENISKEKLTLTDLNFTVAPRINAAGRMKHGAYAVNLLREKSIEKAKMTAESIELFNSNRQKLDQKITQEALLQIEDAKELNNASTIVYDPLWNKGVIGIVASRLIETYYRPTLVFTKSGEFLTASARSVKGYDIYEALQNCSQFIEQFGGHKYAAGLTVKESNYKFFRETFEKEVLRGLPNHLKLPEIRIDKIIKLSDITPKFYRILKQFAPFGPDNNTPLFMTKAVVDSGYGKCVGNDNKHLKIKVKEADSYSFNAIGFGLGNKLSLIRDKANFDILYSIDENHWDGRVSLQLKLKDLKN